MIRVFPRKTKWTPVDRLAFVGDPPLFRPPGREVFISCAFTWDIPEAERLQRGWSLYYPDVRLGGPAVGSPAEEFVPGRFLREGVTITSRGCPNHCPWCLVPEREGSIRELPIMPGWNVQDNNLLACSEDHVEAVFDMLRQQTRGIVFGGGLEAARFTGYHSELLQTIKVDAVWFACDTYSRLAALEHVAEKLDWMSIEKKRCYVLIGFDHETLASANSRLMEVYDREFLPMPVYYRPATERKSDKPVEWRKLIKFWSRPAIYRSQL